MNSKMADIYNNLLEIAFFFGNRGYEGKCCQDLTLVEFLALRKIQESGEATAQEIGLSIRFTKSGATRIIDRLQKKGYVSRKRSPGDARFCCVTLSNKGRTILKGTYNKYTSLLEDLLENLNPKDVDGIKDAFKVFAKAIDIKSQRNNGREHT